MFFQPWSILSWMKSLKKQSQEVIMFSWYLGNSQTPESNSVSTVHNATTVFFPEFLHDYGYEWDMERKKTNWALTEWLRITNCTKHHCALIRANDLTYWRWRWDTGNDCSHLLWHLTDRWIVTFGQMPGCSMFQSAFHRSGRRWVSATPTLSASTGVMWSRKIAEIVQNTRSKYDAGNKCVDEKWRISFENMLGRIFQNTEILRIALENFSVNFENYGECTMGYSFDV